MAQKNDVVHASECKCCVCGEQAVAFWPVVDPDIPSNPYCRKCLEKAKAQLLRETLDGIYDDIKRKKI